MAFVSCHFSFAYHIVICTCRLKKQESAFVALSTKNFPREAKESAKVDVGNTSKDSLKPDLDVQTSLYSKERAKVVRIVVSVRNSDKEELRKCRMLVVYSRPSLRVVHDSQLAFFNCNHLVV